MGFFGPTSILTLDKAKHFMGKFKSTINTIANKYEI